jgi:hypothetical protein
MTCTEEIPSRGHRPRTRQLRSAVAAHLPYRRRAYHDDATGGHRRKHTKNHKIPR